MNANPGELISVLMPTYNQAEFIKRAILSLINQTYENWELIIIIDGATDNTYYILEEFKSNPKIRVISNQKNMGLGYSLNIGLENAKGSFIGYLPSDDYMYLDHLAQLYQTLNSDNDNYLAVTGIRFDYQYNPIVDTAKELKGSLDNLEIQLIQVLHRKAVCRWVQRAEMVTDNLNWMYWNKLMECGILVKTNEVTCEWVNHPHQRHKKISQRFFGGLTEYRQYYNVKERIHFKSDFGIDINEKDIYREIDIDYSKIKFKEAKLKILLVGELAYHPERIVAFEEHGHHLFGLWLLNAGFNNTVGPLPFGNVTDLSFENWEKEIKEIKPDIIYAQLNAGSIFHCHNILKKNTGIPFVWHFKEGPTYALENKQWKKLIELYTLSDGQIYIHQNIKDWYELFIPKNNKPKLVLDGDLPKMNWFKDIRSPLLSDRIGGIHTLVCGRFVGLVTKEIKQMIKHGIHFHFYGANKNWSEFMQEVMEEAHNYVHFHPYCKPNDWVQEFSQYDAGWLHNFKSENLGDIVRAGWNDLNVPARISTYAAAGLPMIQYNNHGHIVTSQSICDECNMGIYFNDYEGLAQTLGNREYMQTIRDNTWKNREKFTFDYHVPRLIKFFDEVIKSKNG